MKTPLRCFPKKLSLYVMFYTIWYHLYNLKTLKNTDGGVSLLVLLLLKVTLLHRYFSRFLNCTNGTKSHKTSLFSFDLGFPPRPFTNHRTAGERARHFFNSSLPHPPASQTLRHQPGNYCRELTSAHRQQPVYTLKRGSLPASGALIRLSKL